MRAVVALVSLAFVACGGTDDGRPAPPAPTDTSTEPVDYCGKVVDYELFPLMDFEGGAAHSSLCDTLQVDDTASCRAYASQQRTNVDNVTPECKEEFPPYPPQGDVFGGDALEDERCGEPGSGVHYVTSNIGLCLFENGKGGWGANFQVESLPIGTGILGDGNCGEPPPGALERGTAGLDASCWDGIALWARKGHGPTGSTATITVGDAMTNPPYCTSSAPSTIAGVESVDTEKCDAPGAVVTLTDEWQFVVLPFTELKQKGFGVPHPLHQLDKGNLTKLQVLLAAGDWDVWFDDIALYRDRN